MTRLLVPMLALLLTAGVAGAQEDVQQFDLPPLEAPGDGEPMMTDPFAAEPDAPPADAPPEGVPAPAPKVERVANKVAEFSGIDKITGRITAFDVYIGETVQFGALQVTPRVCYTSPVNQAQKTDTFVEVDEITLDREIRRIFTGWMFSDSPGLNAVEHPVYDVWLKGCKTDSAVPPPAG
jgi:hypothetical protein